MLLKRDELIYKCGMSIEDAKLIQKYQKLLPILTEDGNGFCVEARKLHEQLKVGRKFSDWIKEIIEKGQFVLNEDYEICFNIPESVHNIGNDCVSKVSEMSPQKRSSLGISEEYTLNLDMAKQIAMFSGTHGKSNDELKERSKLTRKYFLICEKALKTLYEWNMIRTPEKRLYKEMTEELRLFLLRNYNKEAKFYDYMNEADAINRLCLGAKAKDIRDYIDAQDNNTREWLDIKYNEYICKIEELNILYLKMNMEKERRYDMLKMSFKALYPEASFVMADKDWIKNIKNKNQLDNK